MGQVDRAHVATSCSSYLIMLWEKQRHIRTTILFNTQLIGQQIEEHIRSIFVNIRTHMTYTSFDYTARVATWCGQYRIVTCADESTYDPQVCGIHNLCNSILCRISAHSQIARDCGEHAIVVWKEYKQI